MNGNSVALVVAAATASRMGDWVERVDLKRSIVSFADASCDSRLEIFSRRAVVSGCGTVGG